MAEVSCMNPKVRDKWAAALESGEYHQTTNVLQDSDGYCCLGVLCDLAIKDGLDGLRWDEADGMTLYVRVDYEEDERSDDVIDENGAHWQEWDNGDVPEVVRRWARVSETDPVLTEGGNTAIHLNDSEGYNFEQIAALVRDLPTA